MKIALELNNNNVIIGSVYLASEDYTNLMANDNRFTLADVENVEDIIPYKTKYQNGQLVQLNDYSQEYYDKQLWEEQKRTIEEAIKLLEEWFEEYDMQIKQYNRDVRLGITGTYHIGENEYTIEELDEMAVAEAEMLNENRQRLKNYIEYGQQHNFI